MRFNLYLALGTLTCLAARAQTTSVGALQQAIVEYKEGYARLVGLRSDCERTLSNPLSCNRTFAAVAKDIQQANSQLDTAAQLFVPKVPCATISAVFTNLQGNITRLNNELRDIACSTAVETQLAAKANADAFRSAISDQIPKIDRLGVLFARNNACNNPQSAAALKNFDNAVKAVDADDKKTAQAYTLLGGTLECLTG